jgi:MCP family monocarboxylic acid transporter-like MFS transporter 12
MAQACSSLIMSVHNHSCFYIVGVSIGGLAGCSNVATQQYFDKKRSLACGIIVMGMGLGYTVWPPLTQFLVDTFGWRGAMIILSGLSMHGIPLGALLRPIPKINNFNNDHKMALTQDKEMEIMDGNEKTETVGIEQKLTWKQQVSNAIDMSVFKNKTFMAFEFGLFFAQAGIMCPFVFTYLRGVESGVDPESASLLVSAIGLSSIFSRFFFGWLGDRKFINRMLLMGVATGSAGACSVLSYFGQGLPLLMTYSLAFGLAAGQYIEND